MLVRGLGEVYDAPGTAPGVTFVTQYSYLNILLGKERNSVLALLERGINNIANDFWKRLYLRLDRRPEMKWDVMVDT